MKDQLEVDIAQGVAEWQGNQVAVAVAIISHIETGAIVWESPIAMPFIIDNWLDRCVAHMSTLRSHMRAYWPEVECYVNWWLIEPGAKDYPFGLEAQ